MGIAGLSRRALALGAGLPGEDAARLAAWLYRYGTLPRTPEAERDLGPGDDPMAALGLTPGGAAREVLEAAFAATTHPGWIAFAREEAATPRACKLYISPRPEALPAAFPRIAAVLAAEGVPAFKIGRGIPGLLRPDKIVAYFGDRAHLRRVAAALGRALAGCPAQGVPFTAAIDRAGLLSWGVDPPADGPAASWRAWVTREIAAAMVAAPARARVAAAEAALAARGVDPRRWVAAPHVFGAAA